LAANYLYVRGLLDITTTYVARILADPNTPDEIRKRFNIKNDLTHEDLEKVRKQEEAFRQEEEEREPTDPVPTTSTSEEPGPSGTPEAEVSAEGVELEVGGEEKLPKKGDNN